MSEPTTPHTPHNWDAASTAYHENFADFAGLYVPEVIGFLEPTANDAVLEVAAGSGALTTQLAPRVASLLATDFSPKMLEILDARVRDAALENVRTRVMDGQALEVKDASFDRAVCNFGIMLFPDRAAGLSEMRRSLRPGGRGVVSAWSTPARFETFGAFMGAIAKALPDFPPPAGPPPIFSLADPQSFTEQMEAAGFSDVRVEHVSHDFQFASAEDLWRIFAIGAPPAQALFDRIGPENVELVHQALLENMKARFGDGPVRMSNVATVGIGHA
jgi:SAM-dependent methyltransferase